LCPYICALLFFLHSWAWGSSLTFFFLLRTLGKFATTFFLLSNVVYISSLVLLTSVNGFCGFSFWCTNKCRKIFANIKANWHVSFLSPLLSLTYLYHRSSSLHKLLNTIVPNLPFALFYPHQCYSILVVKIMYLFPLIFKKYNGRISNKYGRPKNFAFHWSTKEFANASLQFCNA
jgi:hypothetical protein